MQLRKLFPSPALRPYVRTYWFFDVFESDIPFSQLLFPFGSLELIINLTQGPNMKMHGLNEYFRQPEILFPGQFTKPFILNFAQRTKCIGISLQPWMGNFLFKVPSNEFTDKIVEITDIKPLNALRDELLDSKDESNLIIKLEQHLLKVLSHYHEDIIISKLAKSIIQNPTSQEFHAIIKSLDISRRRVEQRFLQTIGLSMSTFKRKVRFQNSVNLLNSKKSLNLTSIGLESGYYDQMHFIRDFKDFSGLTPNEYAKNKSEMLDFVSNIHIES